MTIDVLLPFYGDVELFKTSVQSVLNQDSEDWRLVIINDAHPDLTVDKWIRELENPRVMYLRNDKNLGPSANYMRCLDFVESSHLVFFGADDVMHANFISRCHEAIDQFPDFAIMHPKVVVIDDHGKPFEPLVDKIKRWIAPKPGKTQVVANKKALSLLMIGDWMYFPSIVWQTSFIKSTGFRPELNVCQDLDTISRILIQGGTFVHLNEEIFSYRRFAGSDSSVKLLNGKRFREEKGVYMSLSEALASADYKGASVLARIHLTSRLHALTILPRAIRTREALKPCLIHIFT